MDYIVVKCRDCGKWNHVRVDIKHSDATDSEVAAWNKSAGPTRVVE